MDYEAVLQETTRKLAKALGHLAYSYHKIQTLVDDLAEMDDEVMEVWEGFTSRFARVSDIFISQYVRTRVMMEEPGYKGTGRDFINKAEQLGLIKSAQDWTTIRELRNVETHEYNEESMTAFYRRLKSLCPILLDVQDILDRGLPTPLTLLS